MVLRVLDPVPAARDGRPGGSAAAAAAPGRRRLRRPDAATDRSSAAIDRSSRRPISGPPRRDEAAHVRSPDALARTAAPRPDPLWQQPLVGDPVRALLRHAVRREAPATTSWPTDGAACSRSCIRHRRSGSWSYFVLPRFERPSREAAYRMRHRDRSLLLRREHRRLVRRRGHHPLHAHAGVPRQPARGRSSTATVRAALLGAVRRHQLRASSSTASRSSGRAAVEQMRAELAQAELRALRAQIQPHFLFNTLNSIASLIPANPRGRRGDDDAARRRVPLRAPRLRARARARWATSSTFLRAYLEIERTRFGERLRVEEAIEPGLEAVLVPSLLLQPLVENAVRHGVSTRPEGGTRHDLAARRDGDRLVARGRRRRPGMTRRRPRPATASASTRCASGCARPGRRDAPRDRSAPGRGTRVRITLPAVPSSHLEGGTCHEIHRFAPRRVLSTVPRRPRPGPRRRRAPSPSRAPRLRGRRRCRRRSWPPSARSQCGRRREARRRRSSPRAHSSPRCRRPRPGPRGSTTGSRVADWRARAAASDRATRRRPSKLCKDGLDALDKVLARARSTPRRMALKAGLQGLSICRSTRSRR